MLKRAEWICVALLLLGLFGLYKTKAWLAAKNHTHHAARLNSGCGNSCGRPYAFLNLATLLPSGCGKSKPVPAPALEQQRRWEELRRQLQQTLGEKYNTPIPAATVPQLKRGSELFVQLCAGCHGARGDGKAAHPGVLLQQPSNFTDATQAAFFSEQARLHIIRNGITGTAMMGWKEVLPESDVLAIYLYVRYLHESAKPSSLMQEIFGKNK